MPRKVMQVLSGGCAKGAFQIGAIQYIEEVVKRKFPRFDYDLIAGDSVGSLNGEMPAQHKYRALKFLRSTLTNDGIYKGKSVVPIVWRLLRGKDSVLSNNPLREQLRLHFSLRDIHLRSGRLAMQSKNKGCLLRKKNEKPYRVYRTLIIQPVKDPGDSLDLSAAANAQ